MIAKYVDSAAKMARLMFDSGASGMTKEQALDLALEGLPASPFTGKLAAALRKYFKE